MGDTVTPLTSGARLRSQVCETEVIVVRPGTTDIALTCGGHPMIAMPAAREEGLQPSEGLCQGTALGKRYSATSDDQLEVLVTKSGRGTLGDGQTPLIVREAKPLPASD